jgi:hypothetical protein
LPLGAPQAYRRQQPPTVGTTNGKPAIRRIRPGREKSPRTLRAAGFRVAADGSYGRRTETAVRDFQRKQTLLPDGIVGPRTERRLTNIAAGHAEPAPLTDLSHRLVPAILPPAIRAQHVPAAPGARQPARQVTTSDPGLLFIFAEESDKNSGNVSWPRGHSGVTLGPGYDMKARSATQIAQDMRGIGLSHADAITMSTAAGLSDVAGGARSWVGQHLGWPGLRKAQQVGLLRLIVPAYEAIIHRNFHSDLWQYQFDALVSVAYNPARPVVSLARLVDAGKYADAAVDILARTGSSQEVVRGLKIRREKEVALFLYGEYGNIGTMS